MDVLYKRYVIRLRLLRSSDDEKYPEPRASRTSCHVVYANIRDLHKKFSDLFLAARGVKIFFCTDSRLLQEQHFRAHDFGFW